MNIYLVRHGETEHNRLGYYSNEDEDLNEKLEKEDSVVGWLFRLQYRTGVAGRY